MTLIGGLKSATVAQATSTQSNIGTIETLGKVLFTDFLLPFELSSILFLAAMVGAVYLSKNKLEA